MKDIKKIQEFFSKPLEENTFKVGQKVTYLGHPAIVTATKEYNGRNYVSVSYDKGTGKTKASDILTTDGSIKPLKEMMSLDDQAKAYYLEKFKKGEISSLPEDPKAAFLDQMTKDEMEKDAAQYRRETGLEEVSAEYSRRNKRPIKVGDIVGNTVQGFDFKVLDIQDDLMKVKNFITGKEFMTDIDNMQLLYPDESINEAKFTDYSNNELAAYAKELSKQRADAASKGQSDLVSGINKEIEAAVKELKKRTEKIKGLTRTDVNEQADHVDPMVAKAYKDYIKAKKDSAANIDFAEDPEKAYRYYSRKLNNTYSTRADRDAIEAILKKKYGSALEENKPVANVNRHIKAIQIQLDQLGVKYEMSGNPYKPFKAVYKPINKDDKWYDNFEDIVFRYNLGGVVKSSMNEAELTEAFVPRNIAEFAKRKGVSSLVKTVAGWAEKVGKRIVGGTAIGKNYDTLILDMTYQGSEIRINTEYETVELYDEPVRTFAQFKRVYEENQEENLDEVTNDPRIGNPKFGPAPKQFADLRAKLGDESLLDKIQMINVNTLRELLDELDSYNLEEAMGGQLDEKYFIEVAVRDARKAIEIFRDQYSKADIEMYGSNVYASNDFGDISDFYMSLMAGGIEILDSSDFDEEPFDFEDEDENLFEVKKGFGDRISPETFAKLKGQIVNYFGNKYKVTDSDKFTITIQDEDGETKTINLNQFIQKGLIPELKKKLQETIQLGEGMIYEELCPAGRAYIKRRKAAGEKSSAYLSGRAVKVCKGQMKG